MLCPIDQFCIIEPEIIVFSPKRAIAISKQSVMVSSMSE